jgi:hypothetical protein
MPFVLLIIIGVIAYVVLHRSMFGRYLYVVGRNEDAARYVCGLVRFHGPASLRRRRKTRTINLNFKVAILRVTEFDKAIFGDCSEIAFGVSA